MQRVVRRGRQDGIPGVSIAMKRVWSALVLSGGIALTSGALYPVLAGAPIPEMGGAPLQSIAPIVSRVTPGVVGISVRGRVREDNPLLQDPMFRRFFNMQREPIERETIATHELETPIESPAAPREKPAATATPTPSSTSTSPSGTQQSGSGCSLSNITSKGCPPKVVQEMNELRRKADEADKALALTVDFFNQHLTV